MGEILLVPGSTFSLLAGATLGPWLGALAAWLGAALSAAVAFHIGRHLGEDSVEWLARSHPRLKAVRQRMVEQGWRWVAALRISPVVPYAMQTYLAGVSSIRFLPSWLASLLAMGPTILLYTWAGHTGAEVALASAGEDPLTRGEWLGLVAAAVVVLVVTVGWRLKARSGQDQA